MLKFLCRYKTNGEYAKKKYIYIYRFCANAEINKKCNL